MSFSLQRINRDGFHIVSVAGYMGEDECARLECELERLLHHGHPEIMVDFGGSNDALAVEPS